MSRLGTRAAVVVAAAATLATGVGLGATVFSSGPAGAASAGAAQARAHVVRSGLFRGVDHADIKATRWDDSTFELFVDGGVITDKTDSSISIHRPDGANLTLSVDRFTLVIERGRRGSLDDLSVGDRAMFVSQQQSDGSFYVRVIRCIQMGS